MRTKEDNIFCDDIKLLLLYIFHPNRATACAFKSKTNVPTQLTVY